MMNAFTLKTCHQSQQAETAEGQFIFFIQF